ncbi:hypothetical protein, partial [Enterococcus faecium]|uniref:hypothetical protein n=1 Tax=Enterococcus faecium TaxID=1352 RepID=UPI003DA16F83
MRALALPTQTRPAPAPNADRRESTEIDALARSYRAGDRTVLSELHAALRPIIQSSIARTFQLGPLPGPLESRDLEQQSWILLA